MGFRRTKSILLFVQMVVGAGTALSPLAASAQTEIDNDLPETTIGHMTASMGTGGNSIEIRLTAERKSQPGVPYTSNLLASYLSFVDVGSGGAVIGAPYSTPVTSGDDQVTSTGTLTGSLGNTIDWTVTTSIPDGDTTITSIFVFTAQTDTLGNLMFYQYLDEDIDASNGDDVFYYTGSVASADIQLYTADNIEVYGLSHGGAYNTSQGLVNASFIGWAASSYFEIYMSISDGTLDDDIIGAGGEYISAVLSPFSHADLGTVWGPDDVGSAVLYQVDPSAATATIVTTIGGVPSASHPSTATNMNQTKAYLQGAASVELDDIVVSDEDVGETITATLTLSNTSTGALTAESGQGETYNPTTGVWSITGLETTVNTALAAVAFVPQPTNSLDTTVITHVEDAGGMGPANGIIELDVTPCEANCDACSDATTCTDCSSGYYLHNADCVSTCPTGYYADAGTGTCVACESNCDSCTDASTCTDCSSGYYLHNADCVSTCPTGYFADAGTGTCVACETDCDACTDASTCTDCSSGYFLHNSDCVSTCPTGYYADAGTGTCVACETNCDTCTDATTCTDCSQSYYLHEADCLDTCPAGYYADAGSGNCDACDQSCAECDGPTDDDCTACDQNDLLDQGHCYPQVCSDEIIAPNEECDDGNLVIGDGCSDACQVEHGYECSGEPSVCESTCGDGLVASDEACDDANNIDGDGCGAECVIESGHSCAGEPSICEADCGNGILSDTEECDDNNNIDQDGCSSVCTIEEGYACEGEPSVCEDGCGNGVLGQQEECDDQNLEDGDGCSHVCTIEEGHACADEPSTCEEGCGDDILGDVEECDDQNLEDFDGCSGVCTIEHGYYCEGEPSICTSECGDDLVADIEGCDDGNTQDYDGCSSLCQIEPGYSCEGEPSVCGSNCGDGLIGHTEECDDGNDKSGDGCSAACEVEDDFVCVNEPSICRPDFDSWDLEGGGCTCSARGDRSMPASVGLINLLLVVAGLTWLTKRKRKGRK